MVKNLVATYSNAEKSFFDLLTPYAFDYVKKQLSLKAKVVCEEETDTGLTVLSHEGMLIDIFEQMHIPVFACIGILNVTRDTCSCKFSTTMLLPCHHVLAVRESVPGFSLYSEDGIADRWKNSYMQQVFNSKCSSSVIMADESYQVKFNQCV